MNIKLIPCVCAIFLLFSSSMVFADTETADLETQDAILGERSVVEVITYDLDIYNDMSKALEDNEIFLYSADSQVYSVTANDATGLKRIMLQLIGDYEAIVTDYEYRNNNATYMSHSINIEKDWAWIASACIFGVVLWSSMRFLYVLVKGS